MLPASRPVPHPSVQAQSGEARKAFTAAERQVEELRAGGDELRATLNATAAQARATLGRAGGLSPCMSWSRDRQLTRHPTLPVPPVLPQLEEVSAEFASFRGAAEKEASDLRSQLASAEAERERLAAACADAAAHQSALQQQLAEAQVHGTPKVGRLGAGGGSSRHICAPCQQLLPAPCGCSLCICCAAAAHHTQQGNAAKETVRLAFEKIRGLQLDVEEKIKVGGRRRWGGARCLLQPASCSCHTRPAQCARLPPLPSFKTPCPQEVKSLEAQLEAQQDIAAQLSAELESKTAALAAASASSKTGAAEAAASQAASSKQLKAAQKQVEQQAAALGKLQKEAAEARAAAKKAAAEAAAQLARVEALSADAKGTSQALAAKSKQVEELAAAKVRGH